MRIFAAAAIFTPTASSATSPDALFASMVSAGGQQRSVHVTSVQSDGSERIAQIADAGMTQGIQRITFTYSGQTGHVTVLVIDENAYVFGDTFTLTYYMGYNADAAATYSERWIQIPAANSDFYPKSRDVTLRSALGDLFVPTPRRLIPKRYINGRAVIGVTGTAPAIGGTPAMTVSLYMRATGSPLPVEEDIIQGSYQAKLTFSRWNERVQIATPAGATPLSTTGLK